ncbi:hypothetical protein T440DRAFT_83876 [Plenodomus tracheiphilus IPT5]|uniref:Uncharacterized protein n=1 Tax=Plenodomus tracheiphilus IPT5 TaxID=1408161 RepID=A0A6A7B7K9_9PLEO|nr:hypothetical protein T440DRAFT_83876 [Plenodomus tracheiphilus IPT5]
MGMLGLVWCGVGRLPYSSCTLQAHADHRLSHMIFMYNFRSLREFSCECERERRLGLLSGAWRAYRPYNVWMGGSMTWKLGHILPFCLE